MENNQNDILANNVGDENFTMDLHAYLVRIYQEQGYNAALAAMEDFLVSWENCNVGPTNLLYQVNGIDCTREEYAAQVIGSIEASINVETTEDNWEVMDDKAFLQEFEKLIQDQYAQYAATTREIARLVEFKENICDLLTSNVTQWAHYRFKQPNPNPESVSIYLAAKQSVLKTIVPGYGLHRTLVMKMKQMDEWIRIVDDPSGATWICNQNEAITNPNTDASQNFDASQIIESSQ